MNSRLPRLAALAFLAFMGAAWLATGEPVLAAIIALLLLGVVAVIVTP